MDVTKIEEKHISRGTKLDEPNPAIISQSVSVKIYTDREGSEIFIGDPRGLEGGSFLDVNQAKWLSEWLASAVEWIESNKS